MTDPAAPSATAAPEPSSPAGAAAVPYLDELAARAAGSSPAFLGTAVTDGAPPTIADARRHLDEAWVHSSAGTEVPAEARMRQVKKAVLLAMRPVTSHQVQFNQQLSVAVKELAVAVDGMVGRLDGADASVDAATTRVHAALATVEVTVDDLVTGLAGVQSLVADLVARTDRLEGELAAERAEARVLRARQDIVLRNATAAIGGKAEKRRLSALASELDTSAELLAEDLIELTRGSRADVRAEVEPLLADVGGPASGPVVDLGFGRGEWLELLVELGVEARGVDASRRAVAAAAKRGLAVEQADAIAYLAGLDEETLGAVTAFHLVERLGTAAQIELLDRALAALRPGGLLVLSASNPTALDVGAADVWVDPGRRRPVHPRYLEGLALARGFAEAEVRWLRPADDALAILPDDLAGLAPTRAAALAEQLNRVVAGPRAYAVVARKPGVAAPT